MNAELSYWENEYIINNFWYLESVEPCSMILYCSDAQNQQNDCVPSEDSDQPGLCTQWVAKGSAFLHADSENSDQTRRTVILLVLS